MELIQRELREITPRITLVIIQGVTTHLATIDETR